LSRRLQFTALINASLQSKRGKRYIRRVVLTQQTRSQEVLGFISLVLQISEIPFVKPRKSWSATPSCFSPILNGKKVAKCRAFSEAKEILHTNVQVAVRKIAVSVSPFG